MLPFTHKLQRATSGEQSLFLSTKSNPRPTAPTLPLLVEAKQLTKELCLTCFSASPSPRQCPQAPDSVPHGTCQGGQHQGEQRANVCPAAGPNTPEVSPGQLGDLQGQIRWKGEKRELRGIRIFAQDSREGCGGTNIAFGGHLWQPSLFFLFFFCLF